MAVAAVAAAVGAVAAAVALTFSGIDHYSLDFSSLYNRKQASELSEKFINPQSSS